VLIDYYIYRKCEASLHFLGHISKVFEGGLEAW
jgi:hypothetical protein